MRRLGGASCVDAFRVRHGSIATKLKVPLFDHPGVPDAKPELGELGIGRAAG